MNVTVDLQNSSGLKTVPLRRQFRHWALATMQHLAEDRPHNRLSIRIVDESESAELNSRYRSKAGATNVLSFPLPADAPASPQLGDLAICAQVVAREATEQGKLQDAHWAHLTVHGVLHLNGYDHEEEQQAARMEALERTILQQLGYQDPYQPVL